MGKSANKNIKILIATGMAVICMSCSPQSPAKELSPFQSKVSEYTIAFNTKDIVKMSRLMHDNIEWINIEGSAQSTITANKTALVGELAAYFSNDSKSVSTLSDWSVNGNYVSVKETVTTPTDDGGERVQASIAVYEFEGDLIRRVWYFPAQKR